LGGKLASESFADGQALLQVAEKHGLEGVVSKRHTGPANTAGGVKIKTTAWRDRDRWRLFERG
jgi:ATP-dependent DNA ligase